MGATRNTGYLENLIQYDASDNVAIATSVNPSYKVTLGGSLLGTSAVFSSSVTSQVPNNTSVPQFSCIQTGGNTYGVIGINRNDGTGIATGLSSALVIRSGNATDYPIQFATANNIRLTITSGGNVGIGVTPSAWMANSAALQVIRGGLWHDGSGYISMFNNAYYDGTNWRYISSTTATNYAQVNGTHQWFYAASGTAGNIVTFNPAMIINTSGNVGIGTTDPKERFEVVANWGNIRLYGRGGINLNNVSNNIYYNGSSWVRDNGSYGAQKITFDTDGDLIFETTSSTSGDTSPRMTIAGNGNVSIAGDLALTPNDSAITFSSGAGRFFAGGSERMRLKSDGQLLMDQAGGNSWKLYINQQNLLGGENGIYISSGYYPAIHLSGNSGTTGGGKWVINSFATGYGSGSLAGAMLLQSDKALQFSTNGDNVAMTITTGQDVAIGDTTSDAYRVKIKKSDYGLFLAAGSTTTHSIFIVQDAAQTSSYFRIRGGDGLMFSAPTYNNTTSSAANVTVFSDGSMFRSTASSIRFKENIADWNANGLNTILALKPKTFTYKQDYYKHPEKVMLGLIAEEVAEVCPYLADYENEDGSGNVENVRYANIVVPLIKAIQELNQKIQALENR